MDLMTQIELWNQNDEHRRIIEAVEALPAEARPPQLTSALARAYNNLATCEDAPLLRKAIALLESVESELGDSHTWNFRMGYAHYFLDLEGPALHYFERALQTEPKDLQTREFISDCRERLALPLFERPFKERAAAGWASFLQREGELRAMLERGADSEALTRRCADILSPALADPAFQLGFNGEKYELALTPEGDRARLFQLAYFQRRAPAEVLERWDVLIGRQPAGHFCLHMEGREISAEDVLVWVGEPQDGQVSLSFYGEKLLPVLRENEWEAYRFLSILLEQAIGELSAIKLVGDVALLEAPDAGQPVPLNRLDRALQERGLALARDAGELLECYTAYEMEPDQREDADLRLDVFAGATCCPPIVNAYLRGESGLMDAFHADGAVPGFFYYPLNGFAGAKNRGKEILDFREGVEAAVLRQAGGDAVSFIGGASGIYCGYLDFIAWDLQAVLDAAADVFENAPVAWAAFHPFRRDVGGVSLKKGAEGGEW